MAKWGWLLRLEVFVVMLLIQVTISGANSPKLTYKLINGSKSWTHADADCRSRDGTLVVLDTHARVVEFQKQRLLNPGRAVWTAAYRQNSPWVWVEGCFSAEFLTGQDGSRLAMNHAVECSTVCKASTYAVLKGHMCFCLRDIRDLVPLDARECDLQCPGAPGEMCGGPRGAVSVYSMGGVNGFKETDSEKTSLQEQTVHEMSRSDWKNCVYILKHDTPVWITTDCRKTLPFLCKIYRERGTIIEYKSPRRKTGSWLEARAMCREEGGTLADIHSNNMAAVQALPNHSEYWVGLYRNTSWTWHTDDVIETPLWCTTVVEDKVGELQFQTETCSMPHDFVCQIPIPVAKADASHLVVYVVCGSVVWVLAVVTGIVVFCMLRRRGWCRKNDTTGLSQSSYLDMDDQTPRLRPATSRPPRPLSHSYVNSDVSNAPSSSRTSQFSNDSPPLKSKSAHAQDKPKPAIGNEYASVCMSKIQSEGKEFDRLETGACASGYKNTEGF